MKINHFKSLKIIYSLGLELPINTLTIKSLSNTNSLKYFQQYCTSILNDNDTVLPNLVNRNPRSMELLRIARKPIGYCLDYPTRTFWYRLNFEKRQRHISAWVENSCGKKVITSSSNEWAIAKQLFSNKDISAAQNVGRILAKRCLQAGIHEVYTDLKELEESSQKIKVFLDSITEGGVILEEPPQIREKETYSNVVQLPCFPWDVSEEDVCKLDAQQKLSNSKEKP